MLDLTAISILKFEFNPTDPQQIVSCLVCHLGEEQQMEWEESLLSTMKKLQTAAAFVPLMRSHVEILSREAAAAVEQSIAFMTAMRPELVGGFSICLAFRA